MPRHRIRLLAVAAILAASAAHAVPPPRFPAGSVFHQDIGAAAPHPNSASMIATLAGLGGFGNGRMQIDFSILTLQAPPGAPTATIVQHEDFLDYYLPDCDPLGGTIPIPAGGAIEGSADYTCDNESNDCHLLVVQGDTLYEAFSANLLPGNQLASLCVVTWRLDVVYPPEGRGEHCTSADAAGFPIAPLLFNADEIRAALAQPNVEDRHLGHAIRFILPNPRMASIPDNDGDGDREPVYVRPASHAGGPTGPADTVPYGSRLRLRADFPFAGYNPAAQVILRTMQKYGIVLADGGTIALTGESDRFTTAKWADADIAITPQTFYSGSAGQDVSIADFTVLDTGPQIVETYDCVRSVIPDGLLFADGFE
jgi:serine/threonine-protein kinase